MGDIARSLDLNWGIIVTQIIGFIIALWILKAFAWKPLLKMLDDRKNKIVGDIQAGEKIKQDANRLLDDYQAKIKNIDAEARVKIQEAIAEGNRIAAEIREQAREDSHQMILKSREELNRDIAKARVQLRDDMINMAVKSAEKIISTKLDEAEQKRLLENFLKGAD